MPDGQTRESQEAVGRMRAFEVGIAHFCKDAGIEYEDFAKEAGESAETFGPNLAEAMVQAAEAQQAAQGE